MTGCEVVNLLIDNAVEREYMTECANLLSRMVKGNLKIVLKHHFQKLPRADRKRTILIDISDESHSVPRDITRPDVFIIFQPYYMVNMWEEPWHNPKVKPMTLGITNGFNPTVKKIKDREYDFCFMGQIPETGSRHNFKIHLDKLVEKNKYKWFVKYTESFNSGLDKSDYSDIMSNSKVSLCPPGAISKESFRLFESVKAGCMIVLKSIPKVWFYERFIFFPTGWQHLESALDFVFSLGDEKLQEMQDVSTSYYEDQLSPEPMARYMLKEITSRIHNTDPVDPAILSMAQSR